MNRIPTFIITLVLSLLAHGAGNERTRVYDTRSGLVTNNIGGGVEDRNGLLWFATWHGLICFDGYDFHQVHIHPGDGIADASNHIRDIRLTPEGNIACRTDEDIVEFDLTTYRFRDLAPNVKDSLARLMGCPWRGMTDRLGNRWTTRDGRLYATSRLHHPARRIAGTDNLTVRALMAGKDGRLWVGTRNDSCIRVYRPDMTLESMIPVGCQPYSIYRTRDGYVWVGGKPGRLIRIGSGIHKDFNIYGMAEDRYGRLWFAAWADGLIMCPNPGDDDPEFVNCMSGVRLKSILVTDNDRIVAAGADGMVVGTLTGDDRGVTGLRIIRRSPDSANSLSDNSLISVTADSRGKIYIATECAGIDMTDEESLFGENPRFEHLSRCQTGMSPGFINAMTVVGDTLLVVVGRDNVTSVNLQSSNGVNINGTFWSDSCLFTETAPAVLPDGSWVLGTDRGAVMATPHNLYTRGYVPPLYFISRNSRILPPDADTVVLLSGERFVTLGFAAIDYTDNEGIRYRTRFDDSPWTAGDASRTVTLFDLEPGYHTLSVQSTDRYGRWVDNIRTLTLYVTPEWHETWWARTLGIVLILAILGAVIYTMCYIRRVNRQRRDLLEKYMTLISGKADGESIVSTTGVPSRADSRDRVADVASKSATDKVPGDGTTHRTEYSILMDRVMAYIEANIANPDANVDDMARAAAVSRSTLNRRLNSLVGRSAAQLLIESRMRRADTLLAERPDIAVADLAMACGYLDSNYFQRVFRARRGAASVSRRGNSGPEN